MSHRFPNQGFLPNQGMRSQGFRIRGMNNQGTNNQYTPRGMLHVSNLRHPMGMSMQSSHPGNGQFPMQLPMQFGGPQSQMTTTGMQQSGPMSQNSMTHGPIVQHVMIPVPVPVGTEIPPHLLRPQIITTAAPGLACQEQFSEPHGQFPTMQGRGQFAGIQGQGNFPMLPGMQGQFLGLQDSGHLSNAPFQCHGPGFQVAPGSLTKNPGQDNDELNYYMSNEPRYDKERAENRPTEVYAGGAPLSQEHRRRVHNNSLRIEKRIDQDWEQERKRRGRSRSRGSSKHSHSPEQDCRSIKETHRETINTSNNNLERQERLSRREEFEMSGRREQYEKKSMNMEYDKRGRLGNQVEFGRREAFDRFDDIERGERSAKHEEMGRDQRLSRQCDFDIGERSKTHEEFESNYNSNKYRNYERHRTSSTHKRYEQGHCSSRHDERVERLSREEQYASQKAHNELSRRDVRPESRSRYEQDRQYKDETNVERSNMTVISDDKITIETKHSSPILYTDGILSDFEDRGIEVYNHDTRESRYAGKIDEHIDVRERDRHNDKLEIVKRKLSPVSNEQHSRKSIRDYSPVSDSKSLGELKIHVSDRGRWIESDRDLSPISDQVYEEDSRYMDERNKIDEHRDNRGADRKSLDCVEMISDSESYICADGSDLVVHTQDLSPVSQKSLRFKTKRYDDEAEYNRHTHRSERNSPSRSHNSRHSDDRISHSRHRKHSEDRNASNHLYYDDRNIHSHHDNRKSEDRNSHSHFNAHSEERKRDSWHKRDSHEHSSPLPDHKDQHSEHSIQQSRNMQLNVPNVCYDHNRKGCHKMTCTNLHICHFFIIDFCKFGEDCTKGHSFFKGQPCHVLEEVNPGFRDSNVTRQQIKFILKKRISSVVVPKEQRARHKSPTVIKKKPSVENEPENVVAFDPSFDARNYTSDNVTIIKPNLPKTSANDETTIKRTITHSSTDQKLSSEDGNRSEKVISNKRNQLDNKYSSKKNKQNRKDHGIRQKPKKSQDVNRSSISKKRNSLSPVSGGEDDWEKYEKYETVSEDGLSEKGDKKTDELDNVSSADSYDGHVQIDRAGSFPVPTPENIAVPIGMNDPLVFNRPLKNNQQSYIGPLNRPPPTFPIATGSNAPLFPVIQQGQNLPTNNCGGVVSGLQGPVSGVLPNHLPSPEFMKHVIQNLPQTEHKNVFKNDNTPVIENYTLKKINNTDKVKRDPVLKETIKKLWTFPHKGVVNMSIIEFVTETEAYKEELIAEIVKILVTLELPYVTMKKLLAVIKDKVLINIKSETDMKKILEMYPNNFKIIEMMDSDDENDDTDTKKNVQIKANIGLGFCEKHGFLPFALGKCECNALHLCKFYFLTDCPNKHCKFGHKLKTDHNIAVLKQHRLHRLTGEEIFNFLADVDNRHKETIPSICKYYVREKGCYKGDNTDYESICHSLHLCNYILKGKCLNRECEKSHRIHDKQPMSLLQKYGLDPNELGDEKILQMLAEKALETEKDREKKNFSFKRNQTKDSTKGGKVATSTTKRETTNSSKDTSVTHSETKISSKYFVQNFKLPAICKFYQHEMGCRKKDWGSDGKCFFLHICQHYVNGDCKFGEKCKRSHDFYTGQAAEILEKYNFDLDNLTSGEILDRLTNNSAAPVEMPHTQDRKTIGGDMIEITIECDESDETKYEIPKPSMEVETRVNMGKNDGFTSETERLEKSVVGKKISANKNIGAYQSCNIEDVIKHIMDRPKQ